MFHFQALFDEDYLIVVFVDREVIDAAFLVFSGTDSGLFGGEFGDLEGVSDVGIEGLGGCVEDVGGGLEDEFVGFWVDPVDGDAPGGFVQNGYRAFGGKARLDGGGVVQEEEEEGWEEELFYHRV
mmetsp:Transcript_22873/g.48304  ORF Transcript_22873/g.48304 Transcript_22873/m.48304 type:complete len:125 (-) Transcript_22873:9-383(-)